MTVDRLRRQCSFSRSSQTGALPAREAALFRVASTNVRRTECAMSKNIAFSRRLSPSDNHGLKAAKRVNAVSTYFTDRRMLLGSVYDLGVPAFTPAFCKAS